MLYYTSEHGFICTEDSECVECGAVFNAAYQGDIDDVRCQECIDAENAKDAHKEIRERSGYTLESYAETIAEAFATALEDGWTMAEIRVATFQKLNEWGVDYEA